MHKKNNMESRGLPGGPKEVFTYVTGVFSTEGYKKNSPDVNNPYNIIDSGSITMEGVDFPVMGTDNLGNSQMMTPGNNYQFPGDQVFEIPMAKRGGGLLDKTMECNNCGWKWKAADGGADVSTCHKCGGSALPCNLMVHSYLAVKEVVIKKLFLGHMQVLGLLQVCLLVKSIQHQDVLV